MSKSKPLRNLSVGVVAAIGVSILAACDSKAPATPQQEQPVVAQPQASVAPPATSPQETASQPAARRGSTEATAPTSYEDYGANSSGPQQPIYSDYRPADSQPAPIAVPWAPPPMLAEAVPPQPGPDYAWTGGYWTWHDGWEWAPGRWSRPPRPDYAWQPPYYEHRDNRVVFVDGFWGAPGHSFVAPAATAVIAAAVIGAAFIVGRAPDGPRGSFVPPPPGSRYGLIVPAPPGTSPYVVRGAPPIVAPGMRITNNTTNIDRVTNNTTINRNTTVVNRITNVTIEAPASATANHQAVHATVSPQAHLAAGLPAGPAAPRVEAGPPREAPPPAADTRQPPRAHAPETSRPSPEPARGAAVAPRHDETPHPTAPPSAPNGTRPTVPAPRAADARAPAPAPAPASHLPAPHSDGAEHGQPTPHRAASQPAPRPSSPAPAREAPAAHPPQAHAEPAARPAPRAQPEPRPARAPAGAHPPGGEAAHKGEPPAKREGEKER